jgi:hypothetical protein
VYQKKQWCNTPLSFTKIKITMKALSFIYVAAVLCSVLFCNAVGAQTPSLESVLPAAVQKNLPAMQADVDFIMKRVLAVNPGFKNRQQLPNNFKAAVEELKKQKPAIQNVKLPEVTSNSYDELIATKTKQLGAQSGVVKTLAAFKDAVAKADDNTAVINAMVSLIKSPTFQGMTAADKDAFYYSFATAKMFADYGEKYNMYAMVEQPKPGMGVGGYAGLADDDDEYYYMARGSVCHWLCTMAGAVAGCVGGPGGAVVGGAIGFGVGANACY